MNPLIPARKNTALPGATVVPFSLYAGKQNGQEFEGTFIQTFALWLSFAYSREEKIRFFDLKPDWLAWHSRISNQISVKQRCLVLCGLLSGSFLFFIPFIVWPNEWGDMCSVCKTLTSFKFIFWGVSEWKKPESLMKTLWWNTDTFVI